MPIEGPEQLLGLAPGMGDACVQGCAIALACGHAAHHKRRRGSQLRPQQLLLARLRHLVRLHPRVARFARFANHDLFG
eukprot:4490851-Alexandrium_andersonii.AAC.1